MKTWHLYCEVQTVLLGFIITDLWVCFYSCFLSCERGQLQHPGWSFWFFLSPSKGTINTWSHTDSQTALRIRLRTEPVHKGLMSPDIMTAIRPSTMYCKYYCNVYFSPFMWRWCILTIYLQKKCILCFSCIFGWRDVCGY